jgi:hypothetical protein
VEGVAKRGFGSIELIQTFAEYSSNRKKKKKKKRKKEKNCKTCSIKTQTPK